MRVPCRSRALVRFAAIADGCGAIGLVLGWPTVIAPVLTPLAAIGLGTIIVLVAMVHARLREPKNAAMSVVLLAMCIADAFGRCM